MRGHPISTKCPKCMRGKFGYPPKVDGIEHTNDTRERFIKRERRNSRVLVGERRVICLDCGHAWWSSTAA